MMPPGTYKANVISAGLGYTNAGKEQVCVTFATDEGPISWYGYFSDAALNYTFKALATLGLPDQDLQRTEEMVGADATIVVEHDEYNGQVRPKVRWINESGAGGGLRNPMPVSEIAQFAKRIKARLAGEAEPVAEAEAGDDDQIPF